MKRFYKEVSVGEAAGACTILLDGRVVKTPQRAALALPTETLAAAIAEEWKGQGEEIVPASMPLTKLANTALDRVASLREEVVNQIMAFANDTLCYRAASPVELVARQAAEWDPVLSWITERYGVRLQTTVGIAHLAQSEESLARLKAAVAAYDDFMLAGLHTAAGILASLSLTLALGEKRLSAETAFALSQLDERYQAERWGEDEEAAARTRALLAELLTVEQFLALVRG
jgi:chaperone required for assembly of F1-ATPase